MNDEQTERALLGINAILNRYLVESADGEPRPLRYNPVDYQTLKLLEAKPGLRATDIAQSLGLPATTLQSALDRLVRMDLLDKRAHASDRRAKIYRLSEKGTALRAEIHAQDRRNVESMLAVLDESERAGLVDALEKIAIVIGRPKIG